MMRSRARPPGWAAVVLSLLATTAGCTDDGGEARRGGPAGAARQLQISDALHSGGTRGFLWLPPVVPRAGALGDFVASAAPVVRIDELRADGSVHRTLATFTRTTGPMRERVRLHEAGRPCDADDDDGDDDREAYFYVRWNTRCDALSLQAIYRIRVLVPDGVGGLRELGFADVDVVRNAAQARGIDRDDFVPLVQGRSLRVKFRIEREAVDRDRDGVVDARDNCPATPNAVRTILTSRSQASRQVASPGFGK